MWPTGHPGKTSQDSKDVAEADKFSEENTNTEHMEDEQVIRRFIESVSTVQKSQVSFSFIAMRIRALRRSSSLLAVAALHLKALLVVMLQDITSTVSMALFPPICYIFVCKV